MDGAGDSERVDDVIVDMLHGRHRDMLVTVSGLSTRRAIDALQQMQRENAAAELSLLARLKAEGASDRAARKAADAGGTRSKKTASKATKRSDTVAKNPDLGDDLRNGELGDEQLDAIGRADDDSDGDAANDEGLIGEIKAGSPDEADRIASKWLDQRDSTRAQTRYERQRARRFARKLFNPKNLNEEIVISGDAETRAEMWAAIEQRAHDLYLADGGRDIPDAKHPRTRAQRLYDAAYQLITNSTAETGSGKADGGSRPAKPRHAKHMLHIHLTVNADGDIVGFGPDGQIPGSVLDRYACVGELAVTVFDTEGRTLNHGRTRNATPPSTSS